MFSAPIKNQIHFVMINSLLKLNTIPAQMCAQLFVHPALRLTAHEIKFKSRNNVRSVICSYRPTAHGSRSSSPNRKKRAHRSMHTFRRLDQPEGLRSTYC